MIFKDTFKELTGNTPFPWQEALYEKWFSAGKIPSSCSLPTGLGKTSVVAIWLIALANRCEHVPRRLVYVVNRRTVVDQTTVEVENYQQAIQQKDSLKELRDALEKMCAFPLAMKDGIAASPLALSTLRGQLADNREWSADPARPAVIVGTVDMIGSRLLFSGYGVGFKGKPLHAGFLGQDVLLVHDEAHLEPAFQQLLVAIESEQQRCHDFRPIRVMELTATSRGTDAFELTEEDYEHEEVKKRVLAKKTIVLHPLTDEKQLVDQILEIAESSTMKNRAVIIFVRRVDDVEKIVKQLPKGSTQQLTGTLRGYERDRMADPRKEGACPIFARFLRPPKESLESDADSMKSWDATPNPTRGLLFDTTVAPAAADAWKVTPKLGTVYLVCTSAGEVGVNISADDLICDLSTFESMAQRFGRVNRFGFTNDTMIHVVHSTEFEGTPIEVSRQRTLELLTTLGSDGSPNGLRGLSTPQRLAAFAPTPTILPTSEILFDSWALTTFKHNLPGRPPVEPYLHGVDETAISETYFAWREEVELFNERASTTDFEELLDQLNLKPHELLRVTTYGKGRAYEQLQKIAERLPKLPVWIIEPDGELITTYNISNLVQKRGTEFVVSLASRTVVLPPMAGGLTETGTLDGNEVYSAGRDYDVASLENDTTKIRLKTHVNTEGVWTLLPVAKMSEKSGFPNNLKIEISSGSIRFQELKKLHPQLPFDRVKLQFSVLLSTKIDDEDGETKGGDHEYLLLQIIRNRVKTEAPPEWPALKSHLIGVAESANAICKALGFGDNLCRAIELSGSWHDLGKGRSVWQRGAGNKKDQSAIAKTLHGRPPENLNAYRHELGSLIDVCGDATLTKEFDQLQEEQKNIVLHLIAGHHGRGRPHFPANETNDVENPLEIVESVVRQVPIRFAGLQTKFGRWGTAYLESILRASDIHDSKRIENIPLGMAVDGEWPVRSPKNLRMKTATETTADIHINIDPSNPGQFFACCGIFELAHRMWPGTVAWFQGANFKLAGTGTLSTLLDAFAACKMTNTMSSFQFERFEELKTMTGQKKKESPGVEDEYKDLEKLLRESPIVFQSNFGVNVDWFIDDLSGGSRFKTWAGRQSVLEIAKSMKNALSDFQWRNENCLGFSVADCGLPFNFDSDLGGQGGAVDIGFSFDPLAGSAMTRIPSTARPALELLAFIGLQRFRPLQFRRENRFVYTAWSDPLPIAIAAPAACGELPTGKSTSFEFRLLYRTKYLKSFLPAVPFNGAYDE